MAKNSKRSRLAATALSAAALLCLCGVGGGAVALSSVSNRAQGLPGAYQTAREAGLSVSLNDLGRPVEPELDALPAVQRAELLFREMPEEDLEGLERLGDAILSFESSPEEKSRMQEVLDHARPALDALQVAGRHRAMTVIAPKPRARDDALFEDSDPRPQIPPGDILTLGVQLFASAALLAGEGRDLERARERLETGRTLLAHLSAEKTYIGFRRRTWAEIRLQRALVRIVQANFDRPEAILLLRNFQLSLGPPPHVREAIAGDLALALDAISRRKEEDVERLPLADAFKDMGRADVVGIFTRAVEAMPEQSDDLAAIDRVLKRMEEAADNAPIYGGYAKGYRSIVYSLKDVLTRRRLAVAAIAVAEAVHAGKPPTHLPDLGINGIDPHSGEPFKVLRRDDRIVIYSVGRDTLDDEGRESPPRRLGIQTRDVVFAVPLSRDKTSRTN